MVVQFGLSPVVLHDLGHDRQSWRAWLRGGGQQRLASCPLSIEHVMVRERDMEEVERVVVPNLVEDDAGPVDQTAHRHEQLIDKDGMRCGEAMVGRRSLSSSAPRITRTGRDAPVQAPPPRLSVKLSILSIGAKPAKRTAISSPVFRLSIGRQPPRVKICMPRRKQVLLRFGCLLPQPPLPPLLPCASSRPPAGHCSPAHSADHRLHRH